jgi:hypothetical protein
MRANQRKTWQARLKDASKKRTSKRLRGFIDANIIAISDALASEGHVANMVVNISASLVPAFCKAAEAGDAKPFKNCYDLGKHVVGEDHVRVVVDESLPVMKPYTDIYFGAADLNGTGVRFYGDFCLVLKEHAVPGTTVILDRNSYDLEREPLRSRIAAKPSGEQAQARAAIAKNELAGTWGNDLKAMAALKMIDLYVRRERRLTSGDISDGVLADEDYIEVLWTSSQNGRSFGPRELEEARLSLADVSLETRIAARSRSGPVCQLSELVWRSARRDAEAALRRAAVPVRVVTTAGRVKS